MDDTVMSTSPRLPTDSPNNFHLPNSDPLNIGGSSMAEDTARQSRSETIDLILSCSICQDTLSAIYTNHENNDGLRQGKDNTDGAIVKLWLTECAHITCAKHLEGGGELASTGAFLNLYLQVRRGPFPPSRPTSESTMPLVSP